MSTKESTPPRRVRRSAEASRALILETAERRLAEHGLGGLNVADVARDAGMSHGTLLHHFGSSEGMRAALVERMADSLLDEVLGLEAGTAAKEVAASPAAPDHAAMGLFFEHLFAKLASGGHARLIAWLSLAQADAGSGAGPLAGITDRLDHLVTMLAARLRAHGRAPDPERAARYIVLLVISSAIGLGVARDSLLPELALDAKDEVGFARWLAQVIAMNVDPEGAPDPTG
ncbi:MAG TPA: helix-turn-helix domain-containing protein [Pseudomonadales bacterium]|nr:helix-turn-helix domain-containing protein [Pseudomonadales bacterium]